jgi:sugar-specific transcriptional regulator TrmB
MMLLNSSQMKVFTEIVYLHNSTIGKIAQATGMHRQSVKIILENLMEKRFIKFDRKGNKKIYFPNDLTEIRKNYLSELDSIKKNIPPLKLLYEETKNSQTLNALSGKSGLKAVLLDEIIKGKEICSFHLAPPVKDFEAEYRANDRRRVSLKIPLRILSPYKVEEIPFSKVRKINKKSKIEIFVYATKITIFYMDIESKIFTIKINEVTKLFQDIFNNYWNKAPSKD